MISLPFKRYDLGKGKPEFPSDRSALIDFLNYIEQTFREHGSLSKQAFIEYLDQHHRGAMLGIAVEKYGHLPMKRVFQLLAKKDPAVLKKLELTPQQIAPYNDVLEELAKQTRIYVVFDIDVKQIPTSQERWRACQYAVKELINLAVKAGIPKEIASNWFYSTLQIETKSKGRHLWIELPDCELTYHLVNKINRAIEALKLTWQGYKIQIDLLASGLVFFPSNHPENKYKVLIQQPPFKIKEGAELEKFNWFVEFLKDQKLTESERLEKYSHPVRDYLCEGKKIPKGKRHVYLRYCVGYFTKVAHCNSCLKEAINVIGLYGCEKDENGKPFSETSDFTHVKWIDQLIKSGEKAQNVWGFKSCKEFKEKILDPIREGRPFTLPIPSNKKQIDNDKVNLVAQGAYNYLEAVTKGWFYIEHTNLVMYKRDGSKKEIYPIDKTLREIIDLATIDLGLSLNQEEKRAVIKQLKKRIKVAETIDDVPPDYNRLNPNFSRFHEDTTIGPPTRKTRKLYKFYSVIVPPYFRLQKDIITPEDFPFIWVVLQHVSNYDPWNFKVLLRHSYILNFTYERLPFTFFYSETRGTGKTLFASRLLGFALGNSQLVSDYKSIDLFLNQYNEAPKKRLIILSELGKAPPVKLRRALQQIISMVSDERAEINPKYEKPRTVPNLSAFVATSNELIDLVYSEQEKILLIGTCEQKIDAVEPYKSKYSKLKPDERKKIIKQELPYFLTWLVHVYDAGFLDFQTGDERFGGIPVKETTKHNLNKIKGINDIKSEVVEVLQYAFKEWAYENSNGKIGIPASRLMEALREVCYGLSDKEIKKIVQEITKMQEIKPKVFKYKGKNTKCYVFTEAHKKAVFEYKGGSKPFIEDVPSSAYWENMKVCNGWIYQNGLWQPIDTVREVYKTQYGEMPPCPDEHISVSIPQLNNETQAQSETPHIKEQEAIEVEPCNSIDTDSNTPIEESNPTPKALPQPKKKETKQATKNKEDLTSVPLQTQEEQDTTTHEPHSKVIQHIKAYLGERAAEYYKRMLGDFSLGEVAFDFPYMEAPPPLTPTFSKPYSTWETTSPQTAVAVANPPLENQQKPENKAPPTIQTIQKTETEQETTKVPFQIYKVRYDFDTIVKETTGKTNVEVDYFVLLWVARSVSWWYSEIDTQDQKALAEVFKENQHTGMIDVNTLKLSQYLKKYYYINIDPWEIHKLFETIAPDSWEYKFYGVTECGIGKKLRNLLFKMAIMDELKQIKLQLNVLLQSFAVA